MEKEFEKEIEKRDYLQELKDILELNISSEEKKEMLLQYHESDIADILDELEDEKRKELIDILGLSFFGEVLTYSEDITEIDIILSDDEYIAMIEDSSLKEWVNNCSNLDTDLYFEEYNNSLNSIKASFVLSSYYLFEH